MNRKLIGSAVLAVLGIGVPVARANSYVYWDRPAIAGWDGLGGSPVMKNLYVDLIFWGWGNQLVVNGVLAPDAQQVLNNVQDVATWLNSGWVFDHSGSGAPPRYLPGNTGAGWDPAVHSYGVQGITPGMWVNDSNPIAAGFLKNGSSQLDRGDFAPIVNGALAGAFGAANTFAGTVGNAAGLPQGNNRLALVVTKGTNDYCVTVPNVPQWLHCEDVAGFHWDGAGNGVPEPFGAVFAGNMNYISHEIMEAMTDPLLFGGWTGTATDILIGTLPDEVADECETLGDNDFAWVTADPPYSEGGFTSAAASCLQLIPEQHAPLAATFEYGFRSQPLSVFCIDKTRAVNHLDWSDAGQAASGPYSYGQPSASVKAAGKPTVTYSINSGGERLFVKGTDGALWMHSFPNGGSTGAWTSLGGLMFGDPAAVLWGTNDVLVTVLGTDDHLYFYSVQSGWYSFPAEPPMVGSPAVVSRTAGALDWFAVGEDGAIKWISYTAASGFASAVSLGSPGGVGPFVSTPAIASQGASVMELFGNANGPTSLFQAAWNGSGWTSMQNAGFRNGANEGNFGFQGTPAVVSWGANRFDAFSISRDGNLWWFYTQSPTISTSWRCGTNNALADCSIHLRSPAAPPAIRSPSLEPPTSWRSSIAPRPVRWLT